MRSNSKRYRVLAMTHPKRRCDVGKWLFSLGFVLAALSWQASALAVDDVDVFGPVRDNTRGYRPTEQDLAFELRLGPYLPALPNTAGTTPSFAEELNRDHRVMLGVEADWQALRVPEVLSVGPGAGMGYTRLSNWGTLNGGAYSASLKIWTQWVWAVLRFDMLQQKFQIPFVFYGKLGAARASFWSNNRPPYNNTKNLHETGSAQGLAWAAGAMFDLGFLEPSRSQRMDAITGVNHMYLFWEWYKFNLDDFGNGVNQLGDSTWALGWALDM